MDRTFVDQYDSGGPKLAAAIAGLSRQDMLWIPPAEANIGNWSIQQIVLHLQDSDLIWAARMKSIIAEENPLLLNYDQSKFAANLLAEQQDAARAVQIFDLNRRQFTRVLRKLPDSAFSRTGRHSVAGSITLGQSLQMMVQHLDHHLGFIGRKREKIGNPLKD